MTEEKFLAEVARRAGLEHRHDAVRVTHAVLDALGDALVWTELRAVAGELPPRLAAWIPRPGARPARSVAALVERVRRSEHVAPGFAAEHTQVVCQVLAEALSPSLRLHLARDLPASLAALLAPAEPQPPPRAAEPHARAPAETASGKLSTGRLGSEHPLSEARPGRGQRESVVRADNPHGATKLSSSAGLTQERLGRTVATATPQGEPAPGKQR